VCETDFIGYAVSPKLPQIKLAWSANLLAQRVDEGVDV
jgi:hypothetical protein